MKRQNQVQSSILIFFFLFIVMPVVRDTAQAATSSDDNYSIESQDVNLDNPQPTQKPNPINLPLMVPLANNDQLNASNYIVSSTSDAFSFSLSQLLVDFGSISPTNPVIRTSKMTLASPLQGAQVIASEDRPMTATDKQFVPDTTCDNGLCTSGISATWESALTYGFGYRCESEMKDICDQNFTSPTTYKQFSNTTAGESLEQVIKSQVTTRPTQATIIYKVNISGTQPLGGYRNTITYIAVPNF